MRTAELNPEEREASRICMDEDEPKINGEGLDFEALEKLTIAKIPSKDLDDEADLMRTKWFDYQTMHPLEATYQFVIQYRIAYSNNIKANFDAVGAQYKVGTKKKDFLHTREALAFWRARQIADSIGCRYDFFIKYAMDWFSSCGWKQPPRPSHLYSNSEMLLDLTERWTDVCQGSLQIPTNECYKAENYEGMPHQKRWEEWITDIIAKKTVRKFSLYTLVVEEKVLRKQAVAEKFGEAALEECLTI